MKKFKLLVLSGDPIYGHDVAVGQSFIEQLTRRLLREGLQLTVECYAPMSLAVMTDLLPRLPLQQYDLIVLQPGQSELRRPVAFRALFAAAPRPAASDRPSDGGNVNDYRSPRLWQRLQNACQINILRIVARLTGVARLQQLRRELRMVLDGLQPCGHNVVLVTPFPHQDPLSDWLRRQGRRLFLEEGYRAFMPVFDAYPLLNVGDVCFLPGSSSLLNALGHELVGSALYDYFRAGVVAVGDPSSYRRHE